MAHDAVWVGGARALTIGLAPCPAATAGDHVVNVNVGGTWPADCLDAAQ